MPENQDASLPQRSHVLDMACTPCPQTAYKCLKIRWRSYRGQANPRSGQHTVPKNFPEMPEDQAASLPSSRSIPFMACTPLEMPGNSVASLPQPRRILNTACTPCIEKLSRNTQKSGYFRTASWTWLTLYDPDTA
ncbi:Hypothetical predicted protein [Olea europaea subsp. europaea]|uniref:Uncharacterized protein n=1 Tax=Olea europaea subsp. europaea TaxID=158383 RepID=A0A8S0PHI7_OLEEU|nr:Hypothetical predicted protein [Olea europaea subsp. europaea]